MEIGPKSQDSRTLPSESKSCKLIAIPEPERNGNEQKTRHPICIPVVWGRFAEIVGLIQALQDAITLDTLAENLAA